MEEIVSKDIAVEEFEPLLNNIISVFKNNNIAKVEIMFGYAWANDMEEIGWKYIPVEITKIFPMVLEQKQSGNLGDDDLWIKIPDCDIEMLLCHEGDFHIKYENESELTTELISILPENKWYPKHTEKNE